MDRQIFFRGKTINDNKWVCGYYFYNAYMDYHYIMDSYMAIFRVIPETVGQFTGLVDKKQTMVFEGDMVSYDDALISNWIDIIEWNETHASFIRLHKSRIGLQYLDLNEGIANNYTVIGNIHDNPELWMNKESED
jgi:uncharacterized phage protein (TIGR01671 family)